MTPVTIFRDKFSRSWPEREKPLREADRGFELDLGTALERPYRTDAHFTPYRTPNGHRLNSDAFAQGIAVEMTAIVFDIDCPDVHGTDKPAPESWRVVRRKRVLNASEQHGSPYGYDTRGGLRFLWRLPEPELLRSAFDAQRWTQDYAICCAYLERRYGLDVDPSCADWQRHYRLPRAARDPKSGPENRPLWGDPLDIGELHIDAHPRDIKRAKQLSKAFVERRITSFESFNGDGQGLFFHALQARGDIDRERPDGSFIIRCPNEAQHTSGRTADGSTLLYLPASGERLGAIHCLHAHCQALNAKDWLRFFSDDELQRAEQAAGLQRRERAA